MNRVQSKNKKQSRAVAARQATKSSAKVRSSSESSGVESASEAITALGSLSDTESISSFSDAQSSTSGVESISSTGSSHSQCSTSDDYYSKPGTSADAEKAEEAAKNTEEKVDEEAEKAAVIAKLMGMYKKLNTLHDKVTDARQKNGNLIGETQRTTDYMMNLMEGSSVTEPLQLFLRRKTKYNLI